MPKTRVARVIRAKTIELVNERGAVCASLSTLDGEPRLDLFDRDGLQRISLLLRKDSPSIAFFSKEGHPWFSIGEDKNEESVRLMFYNPGNAPALWAEMPKDAEARLILFDASGREMWRTPSLATSKFSTTTRKKARSRRRKSI
jgi:hypothetical protein